MYINQKNKQDTNGFASAAKAIPTTKNLILKWNGLFVFALLLLLSSCDVSKRITYFQDIQGKNYLFPRHSRKANHNKFR